ncbi:transcription factor EGL1 isoform X1 [Sesamum indicum]|uniref:Transcription factor EGL1 isoform X1 n=1 Tax=Sesamum indicum TaxID=4182 RepID=A0A6I9T9F3_SESIN|nr:transcription factor EGL1 isoform X1 [Sesamum indicum]
MATANQNQIQIPEEVPQNLRKRLALAVRTIQWSYAIFWSISSRQPGVLEWGDGYYNGDIKTRKTVQAAEVNADQLGLQRSDQLRELYESLSLGETSPQAKRPTAALSPEDLTDAEWYFLVCMSFVFNVDQGLPGRTLAKNQTIWLCNAHRADTKVFSRSLLAKSAAIQTIVCFPHLGGVVELGTTELVAEDLDLIQHIKTSFLDSPSVTVPVPNITNHVSNNIVSNNGLNCEMPDCANMPEDGLDQFLDCPDMDNCSPNDCSNDFADNLLREESNLVEVADGEQSWPFMDDAISCLNNSMNSSDCVSHTYEDPETPLPLSDGKRETNSCIRETQECNQNNTSGLQGNDVHYQTVLSNLLKSSHQLILGPYFGKGSGGSSFISWRKDGTSGAPVPQSGTTSQRLLKKVLLEVARMHENCRLESVKNNGNSKPEVEEVDRNHVLSERKRREKINERFTILGSLVPSGGKVDKVSILDHTIEYLRELERRVEELESYKEAAELGSSTQSKPLDAIERTSDNYGPSKNGSTKKPSMNKRKASEMEKTGGETNRARLRDSSTDNLTVTIADKDVLIEMRCFWRECVLLEVMEAISKLHLDTQSAQSSIDDGILSMTLKAKCKGLKTASASVIRQALQRVVRKN